MAVNCKLINLMVSLEVILSIPRRLFCAAYYKLRFANFGWTSEIISPLHLDGKRRIAIGNHVHIQYKSWLASNPVGGGISELVIEDGCTIGHFNHIYATKRIVLRKDVLTADKVYISDNMHGYEDVGTTILRQPVVQRNTVEIGEGSWLGENVSVIGANVGKHCVIGANSVVTHDIPDYSVAVGSPAKVIKRYDFGLRKWIKV